MPGCQKNVDDIVEAVKTGKEIDGYKITKADLQFNAANVIRVGCQDNVRKSKYTFFMDKTLWKDR